MKVLEVHEQILEKSLDSDSLSDDLGDGEKALVREMCNVSFNIYAWKIYIRTNFMTHSFYCRLYGENLKNIEKEAQPILVYDHFLSVIDLFFHMENIYVASAAAR